MKNCLLFSIYVLTLSNGFSKEDDEVPGPFTPPIMTKQTGYITTNSTVYTGKYYEWKYPIPTEHEMLTIVVYGGYKEPYLKLAGRKMSKLYTKFGSVTQYCFATRHNSSKQQRKICQAKAKVSYCNYIETESFNMTYKGPHPPEFKIMYMYIECNDLGVTTTTTVPTPSLTTDKLDDVINLFGANGFELNNSITESAATVQNTSNQVILNAEKTTAKQVTAKPDGIAKEILIPVIVAAVILALVILFLLFCGVRSSQNKDQMKMNRLASLQNKMLANTSRKNSAVAPSNEEIYEEIAPVLPERNQNMQENAYEMPIVGKYGRNEAAIHSEAKPDSVTVRNELYGDESDDSTPEISPDTMTVRNELYGDGGGDDSPPEISLNTKIKDNAYSEMKSANNTVDNVLYAM